MKNIRAEVKNTLKGIKSRLEYVEECISNMENKVMEINEVEWEKE